MKSLQGTIMVPGDKSISHRALMLNGVAYGRAKITNFLRSEDCLATLDILKKLGVEITDHKSNIEVVGKGFKGLKEYSQLLDCKNSGTTARLMLGLLSGLNFSSSLTGDASLKKRPMARVTEPLSHFGSEIELYANNFLPAKILPSQITNYDYRLEVASAQVKSALILAALKSNKQSTIIEKQSSRNHTELMLAYLGADIKTNGLTIKISGSNSLKCRDIEVPGDISSASFFIVAALIVPNSKITIKRVGLNPTRIGILKVLDIIQANYKIKNKDYSGLEPIGDIEVTYSKDLKPFTIDQELVPLLIDELPILALLATQIDGKSTIKDASELRVKESDRISVTTKELNKIGANIIETNDGMIISGKTGFIANQVNTYNDHRISMMLKVAKLLQGDIVIKNDECDAISYPTFENDLKSLLR